MAWHEQKGHTKSATGLGSAASPPRTPSVAGRLDDASILAERKSPIHGTPSAVLGTTGNEQDIKQQPTDVGGDLEADARTTSSLPTDLSKAQAIGLVAVVTGAAFLNTLSVQACVIILPVISRDINIPTARQQWVISAYTLAFGCFMLLWGRLADVYGKRLIFIWGSVWVAVITLTCPFIPNEIGFDLFRGLQGLGAAANVPTAIGILGVTFKPGKAKNYAFATYSVGAPLGSVFGNILAGVVAQWATWKAVFWVLAGLAVLIAVGGHFLIPDMPTPLASEGAKGAVDWIGGTTVTVALFLLLFALTQGNVVGWSTSWIPVLIVIAVVLLTGFVCWQLYLEKKTTRRPLMKVSIFKSASVSSAMIVMALFFTSFNNFLVYATFFYQNYQGLSVIDTMLRFIPTGVVGIITAVIASRIVAIIPIHWTLMWGLLVIAIANLLFAVPIPPDTTYWAWGFFSMCLCVLGADVTFPSLLLFISHSMPPGDQATGAAVINVFGQVGRSIGLAIATVIQLKVQASHETGNINDAASAQPYRHNGAYLQGLRAATWFNMALGLLGFMIVPMFMRNVGKVGAPRR